jgi:hypothetical protein
MNLVIFRKSENRNSKRIRINGKRGNKETKKADGDVPSLLTLHCGLLLLSIADSTLVERRYSSPVRLSTFA